MNLQFQDEDWTLWHGDCREVLAGLPDCSVDSIVTDPPYGLEFMGKDWDAPWKAKPSREFNEIEKGTLGGFTKLPNHSRVNNVRCEACQRWKFSSKPCECPEPKFPNARLSALTLYQQWFQEVATEMFRVLKPGGHLAAFGGTRTYHRMAVAIEDAGFEIRDSLHWVYGSGFPKSLDVSKAIDKQRDDSDPVLTVTRWLNAAKKSSGMSNAQILAHFGFNEGSGQIGHWTALTLGGQPTVPTWEQWQELKTLLRLPDDMDAEVWRLNGRKGQPGEAWAEREVVGKRDVPVGHSFAGPTYGGDSSNVEVDITAPATDAAKQWEGWGTALKPAHEPIVLARKPLVGTVASNVLEWGTGALNIDGTRVALAAGENPDALIARSGGTRGFADQYVGGQAKGAPPMDISKGRWPANVIFDGEAGAVLDEQSGVSKSPAQYAKSKAGWLPPGELHESNDLQSREYGDTGGASRFFTSIDWNPEIDVPFRYVAKPSKRERNAGLDGLPEQNKYKAGGVGGTGGKRDVEKAVNATPVANHHPTVKPLALMRWLVRLVTPPGGTVLDPFAGSGTTLMAAVHEGFHGIGIEMTDEYLPIIEGRVKWAQDNMPEPVEAAEQLNLLG